MNKPMDFVIAFLAILAVVVLLSFAIPSDWSVQRSLFINAKSGIIFQYVNNLDNWEKWSAWTTEKDSTLKYKNSGSKDGKGAKSIWQAKSMGGGIMNIIESEKNKMIKYSAKIQDSTFQLDGIIELKPSDLGTLMVWKVSGNVGMNPISKLISFGLDSYFGPDMERSMIKLKKMAEEKREKIKLFTTGLLTKLIIVF